MDLLKPINIGDNHVNLEWKPPEETRGDILGYDIGYQTGTWVFSQRVHPWLRHWLPNWCLGFLPDRTFLVTTLVTKLVSPVGDILGYDIGYQTGAYVFSRRGHPWL